MPRPLQLLIFGIVLLAIVAGGAAAGYFGFDKGWFTFLRGDKAEEQGQAAAEEAGDEEGMEGEEGEEGEEGKEGEEGESEEKKEEPPPPLPLAARYVRVQATRSQFLHLHEIELYDRSHSRIPGSTIQATLGPQFGTPEEHGPQFLVDGSFLRTQLAHTTESPEAFMQLDLGSETPLTRIILYNRIDCCRERLVGAEVVLRADDGREVCRVPIPQEGTPASRYRIDIDPERCTLMQLPTFPA